MSDVISLQEIFQGMDEAELQKLERYDMRYSKGVLTICKYIAKKHGKTRPEIIRRSVDDTLEKVIKNTEFISHEDAVRNHEDEMMRQQLDNAIIKVNSEILTELQRIRLELNRIGVNYNQEMRLKNLEKKRMESDNTFKFEEEEYRRQYDAILKDCKSLKPEELESLMQRFEEATRKVCSKLCLTQ